MSDATTSRVPSYRTHKATGQARVTLGGKTFYLGTWNSAESKQEYARLIAEWASGQGSLSHAGGKRLTVAELILAYWNAVGSQFQGGRRYCLKDALKHWRELYGSTPACEFGPKALKTLRQAMMKKGWSRNYLNAQVDRICRVIRWGVSEELLSGDQAHALREVKGLRLGEDGIRESEPVKPVPVEHVEAAVPFMPPVVQAMVRLQLLSGCRPGEICILRPIDLNTTGKAWEYRPQSHKTQHHGHKRVIIFGPRAQELLKPWLRPELERYVFCPAEAEEARNDDRKLARQTPMTPSQSQRRPKRERARPWGERYDVISYRRAIHRACTRAGVPAWGPNRLRHTRATQVRREFGLESAQVVLGHATARITEVYAEKNSNLAANVMLKIG